MAKSSNRPGRTLIVFLLGMAITYGLVALAGSWTPALGLDLQGGTRITLQAVGDPESESLEEARAIIDERVNGTGIVEAEVVTEGGNTIAVEIPGDARRDLVDLVQQQAQLRFRLVACSEVSTVNPCGGGQQVPGGGTPGAEVPTPGNQGENNGNQGNGNQNQGGQNNGGNGNQNNGGQNDGSNNRPPVGFADQSTDEPTDPPNDQPSDQPSESPGESGTPSDEPSEQPEVIEEAGSAELEEELAFQDNPSQETVQRYNELQCSAEGVLQDAEGETVQVVDDPDQPLVTCSPPEQGVGDNPDQPAYKYLLTKAVIEGTDLTDASSGIPQGEFTWTVNLEIGGEGRSVFADVSRALLPTEKQFAIVLDGQVISSPGIEGVIGNGQAQISGNFTEASASDLATSLRYGSLPIAFEKDASTTVIGPTLAGNQLTAGLTAGAIGLLLVMGYCLLYYRGLGVVVLASLGVAAAITYAMVLLLSETAGFALTLPGIAGLIIAVGITADSFIILFERIRDEMRDGKSMRVAVESGWVRARNTCLAADAVSLLAAVVLYIFAAGAVRGFAFALGLTTLIDLIVFFWFTKPMVSWLARFDLFNSGKRWSGLSTATLGIDEPATVGGRA